MKYDGPANMVVYDRLGPMARKVVRESPSDVELPEIVRAFEIERRRHFMRSMADPVQPPAIETPEGDAALAAYIASHIARLPRPAYG